MSARFLRSLGAVPWIDLPALDHPQYISKDGYEVEEPVAVLGEGEDGQDEPKAIAGETRSGGADADVEMSGPEIGAAEDPLLNIGESLILHQSLVQSRHQHLHYLLPHIFSHPFIPTHNKPRVRGPPRSQFLFPTPPPPAQPLPYPEYHGPRQTTLTSDVKSSPNTPAASKSTSLDGEDGDNPSSAKGKSKSKQPATQEDEPPAHEIECIGRVTLAIGPFSFPETELWVGKFVEPRAQAPKRQYRTKGEKRSLPEQAAVRRAKAGSGTPTGRPKDAPGTARLQPALPDAPPPRGTSAESGSARTNIPAPPAGFGPLPSAPPAAARQNIPPALIQRVNAAAAKLPWLSLIIHKAARSNATKDELTKLGRVVARLSRGEDVGEGSEDAATQIANPAPRSAAGPSTSIAIVAPAMLGAGPPGTASTRPAAFHTPAAEPIVVDSDSSDEEDIKGPKQVGGGPGPAPSASLDLLTAPLRDVSPDSSLSSVPASPNKPIPTDLPSSASRPHPKSQSIVPQATSFAPSGAATSSPYRPVPQYPPSAPDNRPSPNMTQSPWRPSLPPPSTVVPHVKPPPVQVAFPRPPPPPKPTFPPVPRFLLVAFREQPTEKFLIPLGASSYVSRVGGDFVTDPPPPSLAKTSAQKANTPLVFTTPLSGQSNGSHPVSIFTAGTSSAHASNVAAVGSAKAAELSGKAGRGRTRAALERTVKDPPTAQVVITSTIDSEPEPGPSAPIGLVPKSFVKPELISVAGEEPAKDTVLISTIVPAKEWLRPDWEELEKGLPWVNADLMQSRDVPALDTPQEPALAAATPAASASTTGTQSAPPAIDDGATLSKSASPKAPSSPIRGCRLPHGSSAKDAKPRRSKRPLILNLAATDLLPEEGAVQAVTIRLEGVNDELWRRVKALMEEVSEYEMRDLVANEPEQLDPNESRSIEAIVMQAGPGPATAHPVLSVAPSPHPGLSSSGPSLPASLPSTRARFTPPQRAKLDAILSSRKRSRFSHLLLRVPRRTFLRFRATEVDPAVKDALTEKWGLRPYPISLKPLYTTADGDDQEETPVLRLSPEKPFKRGRIDEPAVAFEMPVSLDLLDERVEEGAARLGSKRGRGRGGKVDDGRKRHGRRWVPGTICEGCGKEGLKVWRTGPGGKGTLCNLCGAKFVAGTLGELTAPGAASRPDDVEAKEGSEQVDGIKVEAEEEASRPVDASIAPGTAGLAVTSDATAGVAYEDAASRGASPTHVAGTALHDGDGDVLPAEGRTNKLLAKVSRTNDDRIVPNGGANELPPTISGGGGGGDSSSPSASDAMQVD